MSNYKVAKDNTINNILSINQYTGYDFKPKNNINSPIKVKRVTIVDGKMIDKILSVKFEKYFRHLAALALKVIDDDDSDDDDANVVLDEAKLVKEILENRYKKFLNHEKEELFLKKIRIIENQIQMKKIEIKKKAIYLEMLERSQTRHM